MDGFNRLLLSLLSLALPILCRGFLLRRPLFQMHPHRMAEDLGKGFVDALFMVSVIEPEMIGIQ